MMKSAFLTFFGIIFFKTLCAQVVIFTASAPDSVDQKESFCIEYTVNQKIASINVKAFENFKQIAGPRTSSLTQVSIVKGETTQSYQTTYTYDLMPSAKGLFVIPEASVVIDGRKYYSNKLTIKVTDIPETHRLDSMNEDETDEIYADLSFAKPEAYIQEGIVATLKLYSKLQVNEITSLELPAFEDFLCYELDDSSIQTKRDTINGKVFNTVVLKQVLLYPQKTGNLKLIGGKLKCNVIRFQKNENGKSIFDDFFGPPVKSIEHSLEIDNKELIVKSIPEKEPSNFTDICGTKIKLTATLDKTTGKANTPIVYSITLSGSGNLKLATVPKINLPDELKIAGNSANNNLNATPHGITGSRTFSYTILPTREGNFRIPAYSLTYFDLDSNKYKTITAPHVWINVEKSGETPSVLKSSSSLKEKKEEVSSCDLMIVMDVSSTMLAQDLKPDRKSACINATRKFVEKQKGNVGLVIFSKGTSVKCFGRRYCYRNGVGKCSSGIKEQQCKNKSNHTDY
jgi:hypothetical protein